MRGVAVTSVGALLPVMETPMDAGTVMIGALQRPVMEIPATEATLMTDWPNAAMEILGDEAMDVVHPAPDMGTLSIEAIPMIDLRSAVTATLTKEGAVMNVVHQNQDTATPVIEGTLMTV